MRPPALWALGWVASVAALTGLSACEEHPEMEIVQVRENGLRLKVNATTAERFFKPETPPNEDPPSPEEMARMFQWTLPDGWEQLPARPLRIINLKVGVVECYLTLLTGGTAAGNINRWRRQLDLPPLKVDEVEVLKQGKLLDRDSYRFDAVGTYQDKPDHRIHAWYVQLPMAAISVTVKMFGPKAAVAAAIPGFDAFCASLTFIGTDANKNDANKNSDPRAHSGTSGSDDGMVNEGFGPSRLQSDVPTGWQRGTGSAMRHVTYQTGGSSECYVTFLGPAAGDWRANVDRWVVEVGNSPPDAATFEALPKITVLGESIPMLESHGGVRSMLGIMVTRPGRVMFVKLTGSRDDVKNQRANFIAYCESLRIGK